MVGVGSGLSVIEVRGWYPFGVALGVGAGGPAFFDESVVDAAGQGEGVDVGAAGGLPSLDVVDLAVVGRCITTGFGAATVLGVQHDALCGGGQSFRVIQG